MPAIAAVRYASADWRGHFLQWLHLAVEPVCPDHVRCWRGARIVVGPYTSAYAQGLCWGPCKGMRRGLGRRTAGSGQQGRHVLCSLTTAMEGVSSAAVVPSKGRQR